MVELGQMLVQYRSNRKSLKLFSFEYRFTDTSSYLETCMFASSSLQSDECQNNLVFA